MATAENTTRFGTALRTAFGAALFIAWAVLTALWIYDAVYVLIEGDALPAVAAVGAILLMSLLAGMEGLEVAVIDRWRTLYPERTVSDLAAWLAARQLFVALIVTAATLLAERESIAIPGTSTKIEDPVTLKVFLLLWTTFTVLWFAQIFPKFLAATNADRYLHVTQAALFPIVELVRKIGVSQPGEWTAAAVGKRLDWHGEPEPELESRSESLADAWAALVPRRAPAGSRSAPPEDRTTDSTES